MRYHDFNLWIDNKADGKYPVRAISDKVGEARDYSSLDPYSAEIKKFQKSTSQRHTDRHFLVDFGTHLYFHLFKLGNSDIEALFEQCCGYVLDEVDTGIRIKLRIEAPEVASLPWEFLYSPRRECFLCTSIQIPLVRYLEIFEPVRALETGPPQKMLVVIPILILENNKVLKQLLILISGFLSETLVRYGQ